jgi:hypothetical protein
MPRPVQLLIVAVVAAVLALAAAGTAPMHSPSIAERYMCPEGTTLRVQEYHASWNTPGETGLSIGCVDKQGSLQGSSERETQGFWILFGIYFLFSVVALLILGFLVAVLRRRPTIRSS